MTTNQLKRHSIFVLLFLVLLAGFSTPIWGQEFRASILGRVTDATDAVIPGASVVVTNEQTNTSQEVLTNDEGNYTVPFLLPGRYTISVEMPGFNKSVRSGVVVQVQDKITLDFKLQVGEVTQSITVNGETPLLRAADANLGQVVDRRHLDRLPISGQSPLTLADMAPGVIASSGGVTSNAQNDISINGGGGQDRGNDVTVDGIPNVAPRQRGLAVTIPMADSIEEFRVATTMFDASNGRSNGGTLAVSTRSGTNELHGSVYNFMRNRALDANSWTRNRAGIEKPSIKYYVYGATVGGPVKLPFYNGTDKTFFFFGYEKTSNTRGITREGRVPTELERQGDFSQTLAAKGGGYLKIFDPYTTVLKPDGKFQSRTEFANARIPASMLNPIGLAVLKQLPLPNQNVPAQISVNNWIAGTTQTVETDNIIARIDQQVSSRQRIYGRFGMVNHLSSTPPLFPGNYSFNTGGTTDFNEDIRHNRSFALDDTFTFSPTLVASFRYGLTRTYLTTKFNGDDLDPADLKLPDIVTANQTGGGWPIFNLSGEQIPQIGSRERTSVNDIHAVLATFNKIQGNHIWRFGLDYRVIRWNESNPNTYANGQFQFNTRFTQQNPENDKTADTSGTAMASLLLGLPITGGGSRLGFDSPLSLQSHYISGFLQDDWKLSRSLTVNLGVRYELETPMTERYNRLSYGFDSDAPLPLTVPGLPAIKGGMTFVGTGGIGRRDARMDFNNFGPRIGFAYSLNNKTVLRGGYGIFFSSAVVNMNGGTPQAPQSFGALTDYVGSSNADRTPLPGVSLSNPFPDGIKEPAGSSAGLMTDLGKTIRYTNPDRVLPYVQQWQLGFQRELPWDSVLEIAWAGAHSIRQLEHGINLNEMPDAYLRNEQSVANPFFGILDPATTLGKATILENRLRVAYPQFDQVQASSLNTGRALYHSLQTRYQKRLSHGLTLLSTYTYSKVLLYRAFSLVNERKYRTVGAQDSPHVFRLFSTADLPFGRGRAVGENWPKWLDHIAGGWGLTWTTEYNAGLPLGFTDKNLQRPIPIRDPRTQGSIHDRLGDRLDPVTKLPVNPYLDYTDFERMPDKYAITPEPPQYGWLRAPKVLLHNICMSKMFTLHEDLSFELRGEVSNPFNTPQFAAPLTDISSPSTFGTITSATGERQVLVGAKIRF